MLASYIVCWSMWNLDRDFIPTHEVANFFGILFIHPWFEFTPPEGRTRGGRGGVGRRKRLRLRGGQLDREGARRLLWMRPLVEEGITAVAVGKGRSGGEEGGGVDIRKTARGRGAMVVLVVNPSQTLRSQNI